MEITSTSSGSFSRPVTQSKNSSDRQSNDENQTTIFETKSKERALEKRAAQEKLQDNKDASQRRLDGRLINFGSEEGHVASEQKQVSFNRSRVNEAYTPVSNQESHRQNNEQSNQSESDAIDIVV